jgi:hypothetical protein
MTTLREAAQLALDALHLWHWTKETTGLDAAHDALRDALADQSEQALEMVEPVAWMDRDGEVYKMPEIKNWAPPHKFLYTSPPQRKPLTDEEIIMLSQSAGVYIKVNDDCDLLFARAIERTHGIGGKE